MCSKPPSTVRGQQQGSVIVLKNCAGVLAMIILKYGAIVMHLSMILIIIVLFVVTNLIVHKD